jgi:hypothetical protein
MVPAGYMAKWVATRPDWLDAPAVADIRSVSACISNDFADYIGYWRHNGYWLFDSPGDIGKLARKHAIDLAGTTLFYYEVLGEQFDPGAGRWEAFGPEPSFRLDVRPPASPRLEGFDVVSFYAGTSPECSPLSCNGLAKEIATNRHCLLPSLDEAKSLLQAGRFAGCEPGPYRILAVHTLDWPQPAA